MSPTDSPTQAGQEMPQAINLLFETFDLIYPGWMRNKSEEQIRAAKKLWLRHLGKCEVSMILQGIEQAPDRFKEFAPTMGQFKDAIMVRPEHREVPRLELIASKNPDAYEKFKQAMAPLMGKKNET